jgi:membrane-associated phospholipid phosphatase
MNLALLIGLLVACLVMMIIERLGVATTLQLSFRGDVKRETQWLSQYGQFVCTAVVAVLIWQLDPGKQRLILPLCIAVGSASAAAFLIKLLVGRVRPKREQAGRFLGPSLRHDNGRESFPSSHSACAVALSMMLIRLYPEATVTWWALALITASLRYFLDAHWPSDVIGGIALGYGCAWAIMLAFGMN